MSLPSKLYYCVAFHSLHCEVLLFLCYIIIVLLGDWPFKCYDLRLLLSHCYTHTHLDPRTHKCMDTDTDTHTVTRSLARSQRDEVEEINLNLGIYFLQNIFNKQSLRRALQIALFCFCFVTRV